MTLMRIPAAAALCTRARAIGLDSGSSVAMDYLLRFSTASISSAARMTAPTCCGVALWTVSRCPVGSLRIVNGP